MRNLMLVLSLTAAIGAFMPTINGQSPNNAQQQSPDYWLYGPVDESCGTWIRNKELYDKRPMTETNLKAGLAYAAQVNWVFGFVSGVGVTLAAAPTRNGMVETDTAAIKAWMDKYCGDHPLDAISSAATVLVAELIKRK